MIEYDIAYLTRRLREEYAAAESAAAAEAKRVHLDLADAYQSKIVELAGLVDALSGGFSPRCRARHLADAGLSSTALRLPFVQGYRRSGLGNAAHRRRRHPDRRARRPCHRCQVCRSPAALPAGADLRLSVPPAGSFAARRLGWSRRLVADTASRSPTRPAQAVARLFADKTTAPVLDPGRGRTKTGQLWAYARDDRPWGGIDAPALAYVYAPDRKAERPIEHLGGF